MFLRPATFCSASVFTPSFLFTLCSCCLMHLLKDKREAPLSQAISGKKEENLRESWIIKKNQAAALCQAHLTHAVSVLENIFVGLNHLRSPAFFFCIVRSSPNPASSSSALRAVLCKSHQDNYSRTGIRSTSICLSFC